MKSTIWVLWLSWLLLVYSNLSTKIRKNIKTCKLFWPASEDFVNSATVFVNFATVFVNSATRRGRAPAAPDCSFLLTAEEKEPKKTATPKPLHRGFNLFFLCSFLLTAEEKEPKKTATLKSLQRDFSLFRGQTLSIKVLVWFTKLSPYG